MDQLVEGYFRFRQTAWPRQQQLYQTLAEGQRPPVCVISCCDSRVEPVAIFDTPPGQLFTIRNVANLVPPYEQGEGLHGTSAAIEFAVQVLRVGLILVLGHERCGGVAGAVHGVENEELSFLKQWIALLEPAKALMHAYGDDPCAALERASIVVSLNRLRGFPFVARAEKEGRLALQGARFSVFTGRLEWLDEASGTFRDIAGGA
ncbi:MAG: carbonic anhydrase [Alphaproteobacteria bacterium]|nr:carbonic anhydrase [Alphaproteobacteria bacterium]